MWRWIMNMPGLPAVDIANGDPTTAGCQAPGVCRVKAVRCKDAAPVPIMQRNDCILRFSRALTVSRSAGGRRPVIV
jgi:hypothetical protein